MDLPLLPIEKVPEGEIKRYRPDFQYPTPESGILSGEKIYKPYVYFYFIRFHQRSQDL